MEEAGAFKQHQYSLLISNIPLVNLVLELSQIIDVPIGGRGNFVINPPSRFREYY